MKSRWIRIPAALLAGLFLAFAAAAAVPRTAYAAGAAAVSVTAQPANAVAADGTKAQFTVKASGSGLTYRWEYQKPGSTKWITPDSASAKTATLSVSARPAVNGFIYRCVITDSAGKKATSASAKLTVKASPYISAQPKAVTAADGTAAKFTVKALGAGLTYKWQYKKPGSTAWTTPSAASAKTATLSVSARPAVNGFVYRCVITDSAGRKATTDAVKLTVKTVAPKITLQPQDQAATDGTTAKFTVKATGTGLTYKWQYKKPGGTAWTTPSAASAKTATLSVSARPAVHGFLYRCVITDANGTKVTSASAHLWVNPKITTQPENTTAAVNDKVKFTVTSGTADAVYQWQFSKAGSTGWSDCTGTAAKTAALTVTASAAVNGRRYRCLVSNLDGYGVTYSNAATLTVSPLIKAQPADVHAADGTKQYFKVTAEGTGLTYQWQYRKTPGASWANHASASAVTAKLAVNVKDSTNGFQYRCVVKDSGGRKAVSTAATLHMALKLITPPADRVAGEGETAVFTVKAEGEDLTYRWQVRKTENGTWSDAAGTGAKTAKLSVNASAKMDGYAYRCVITSGSGPTVTTEPAWLTVTVPKSGMAKAVTDCWAEFGSRVTAEGLTVDRYWSLMYQYPEYFYVAPVVRYQTNTVYPVYDDEYGADDITAFNAEVRRAVNLITSVDGDLNRAVVAYEYLMGRTDYHIGEYNDYSAAGCILDGNAACEGYAKAYYLLLNRAGVPCEVVQSDAMDHDWNMVKIGGKWYYCDVTWDDQTYAYYRFFLCNYTQFIGNGHYGAGDWSLATDPGASFSPTSVNSTAFSKGIWDDPSFTLKLKDGYWYDGDRKVIKCCYPNGVRTRP